MRLADDDRARVPFALIAALLLVTSATLAATVRMQSTEPPEPDVPAAIDRASASTETAVADAVERAARDAARDPVVQPANTTYGRVLDPETPFRDSLRLRIYVAAVRNLWLLEERVGTATATASLPGIENESTLREAIERVSLRAVNGSLRVRIENVTFTARRDGRVVTRERRNVTVIVKTPVLALHDRAERYDRLLDRGPLEGPGLGALLTTYLYGMTWARGYLQYGGFPIANVLANRHLELLTNAGLLAYQRAAFGTIDDGARAAMLRASAQVTAYDLAAAMDESDRFETQARANSILSARPDPTDPDPLDDLPGSGSRSPEDRMEVDVNATADRAFLALLTGDVGNGLDGLIRRTYASQARLRSRVVQRTAEPKPGAVPPAGGDWTLLGETVETETTVKKGPAPFPPESDGWHGHSRYTRHVERTHEVTYTWGREGETTTTTATWTDSYRVGLLLEDRHAPHDATTDNPIDRIHIRGGPLSGRNLEDTPSKMHSRLVAERGGVDALARQAVSGGLSETPVTISGERPEGIRDWIYADLAGLRERVRNVSTNVSRGGLATGAVPARELAASLENRSESLVGAPDRYRSVADKVRVAARAAYLERTIAVLRARADLETDTNDGIGRALEDVANVSLPEVERIMGSRRGAPDRGTVPGPDGPMNLTVDGAPTYLALATVDHDRVPAVEAGNTFRPLSAQNVNVFAVPYGDVADLVLESTGGNTEYVDLQTAALALRSVNRILEDRDDPELERRRDALRAEVTVAVTAAVHRAKWGVANATSLDQGSSERVVSDALSRWEGVDDRALAITNGSAADAVASVARERLDLDDAKTDEIRVRVGLELQHARHDPALEVELSKVDPVASTAREVGVEASKKVLTDQLSEASREELQQRLRDSEFVEENFQKRDLSSVPAGLPVAPVPGYWYATVNFWYVHVRGAYARFTLRAHWGSPDESAGTLEYTRDGEVVALDVDGDGNEDPLGWATRVSFDVETTVAIAVPPGRPEGVGDVDGNVDERSGDWPDVGPLRSGNDSLAVLEPDSRRSGSNSPASSSVPTTTSDAGADESSSATRTTHGAPSTTGSREGTSVSGPPEASTSSAEPNRSDRRASTTRPRGAPGRQVASTQVFLQSTVALAFAHETRYVSPGTTNRPRFSRGIVRRVRRRPRGGDRGRGRGPSRRANWPRARNYRVRLERRSLGVDAVGGGGDPGARRGYPRSGDHRRDRLRSPPARDVDGRARRRHGRDGCRPGTGPQGGTAETRASDADDLRGVRPATAVHRRSPAVARRRHPDRVGTLVPGRHAPTRARDAGVRPDPTVRVFTRVGCRPSAEAIGCFVPWYYHKCWYTRGHAGGDLGLWIRGGRTGPSPLVGRTRRRWRPAIPGRDRDDTRGRLRRDSGRRDRSR